MTERVLDEHTAQWVVQAAARLLATFGILQGLFIITGGRPRWSSPAFQTALSLPGAPTSWGVAEIVLGAAIIAATYVCRPRTTGFALAGLASWCFFFALTFLKTAAENPLAGTSGIFAYGVLAALMMLLAVAYWRGRS